MLSYITHDSYFLLLCWTIADRLKCQYLLFFANLQHVHEFSRIKPHAPETFKQLCKNEWNCLRKSPNTSNVLSVASEVDEGNAIHTAERFCDLSHDRPKFLKCIRNQSL